MQFTVKLKRIKIEGVEKKKEMKGRKRALKI